MQGGCSNGVSLPCAYELVAAGRAGSRSQGLHGNLPVVHCICAGPHQPFVAPVPKLIVLAMNLTCDYWTTFGSALWFCLHSPEFFTDAVTIYFFLVLQALAKQFADILHFTLTFDDLKVNLPYLLLFSLWMYLS